MKKHLIIGAGEVGRALRAVLAPFYDVSIRDKSDASEGRFDVLHIAYPPIPNFVKVTKEYIKQYKPRLVIIHSTVPVGTTGKVGALAVHSPIRGVHPHLAKGVKTFVKYFGGPKAAAAAQVFKKAKVPVRAFRRSETTELLKILDTTYYGWNILFCKETARICEKLGLPFDEVYTMPNDDYNKGYAKLGMRHVLRPVLKPNRNTTGKIVPGKIGGHCIIPNCALLDDWLTNTLDERNATY